MAFEQNQQNGFNLNNGLDQVKQWQAELDKATTSIGAAELASEEELAKKKLANLVEQQKIKVKQLDRLIAKEEEGIRKLAELRLTLSDKQFKVQKIRLDKELKQVKATVDELLRLEKSITNEHSKKSDALTKEPSGATKKQSSVTEDIPTSSKAAKTASADNKALIKDSAKTPNPELIDLVGSIDSTLTSLQGTVVSYLQEKGLPKEATEQIPVVSTTDKLQNAAAQAIAESTTHTAAAVETQEAAPTTPKVTENQYSNDSKDLEKVDLGKYSSKDILDSFDGLREYFKKSQNSTIDTDLNDIIKTFKVDKDEDGKVTNVTTNTSQATLDLAGDLLKGIKEANDAEEQLNAFKAEGAEGELKRRLALAKAEHELRKAHANKEQELINKNIAAQAKAEDLKNNGEQYALEARMARENAFAEEQNRLQEERINALAEIEWNNANRKGLLDQEEQKERLSYLKEYQELQSDGFNHLTENMSAAEFEALRAETAATEKAIKARSKANEAFDKAFAAQRSKGTLKEKNQLIEAIVKERAAEKDWSGTKYEITDDMSDDEKAEIQKKRENAVRAEMAVNAAMGALANLAQKLNAQTDKIGTKQAPIDTRLQGSQANDKRLGSYWKQLARDMNKIGAVSPYFKQEDFANNIETLVNKGISFDIKQRAFLMTIQEKIANTFDVADGTLLRLVRIQQEDTTAGRLGMESALNSFLNSMYETSEYLSDVASSVRSSLEEMQALMEGAAATELEFQIQKWMGSLYSVGMSQDAVQSIAQTFGQIASGDVSGLTGSGTGNLLIMAANEAGMSIADILQEGLDADETNKLMQAMVNYLAEIAETSSDSRVVQQQLANVYGIKASDLRAATNLASSIKDVSKQDLTYSGMLGQLSDMASSMWLRTSTGEFLTNIWDNVQYTMATQMANNPVLYILPKIATLLEDYAGGIDIPFLNVMGFGVDLNTSVAQLMNVAAMSGSILGAIGPMISGLSALNTNNMLSLAGINTSGKAPVIARGSGATLQNMSGASLSESGLVGNSSGDDVKNATLQDAEDSKKKQLVEAKEDESADDVVIKSQQAIIDIYNLLEEVAHGSQSLRVRVINGAGGNAYGSGSTGGGGQTTLETEGDGLTSSSTGSGKYGTDNGNWVLAF